MMTVSKSFVARAAVGLVALIGVAAAVPASARPFEGRGGWGHEHGYVQRGYGYGYAGYGPQWRPAPVYYGYHDAWRPAPVIVFRGYHGHRW